jgi:hypothetical protein
MPVTGNPSWEDLDEFLEVEADGGFAKLATLALQSGETRDSIKGLYDAPALDAEIGTYSSDTQEYKFTAKTSDLSGVTRGDTLTIEGAAFSVTDVDDGGSGLTALKLSTAND